MKRVLLTVAVLVVFTMPAWGQVARTGSCAAAANTCTLSAVAGGDLVIVFAYLQGNKVPTIPAGFTSISSGNTSGSGTNVGWNMVCKKASSGSDTSAGTWNGANAATFVEAAAYSGTPVNLTADCNTTGIGGQATISGKGSTTITYPALTMSYSDSTSWVVAFAVDSAAVPSTTVSGSPALSSVNSGGTAPGGRVLDTNAVANSFPAHTSTVTSSSWASGTAELLSITVATPTANPNTPYTGANVTVTLSTTTTGATVYYTTDGSAPGCSGPSGNASLSSSTVPSETITLKAIACKTGAHTSGTYTGSYTIQTLGVPTDTPGAGTYGSPQTVVLADGAGTLHYTTDNTAATCSSSVYVPAYAASDDFDRADETLTTPWTQQGTSSNVTIYSNGISSSDTAHSAVATYDTSLGDQFSKATLLYKTGTDAMVVTRHQGASGVFGGQRYAAGLSAAYGTVIMYFSGSGTSAYYSCAATLNAGDTMELDATGTSPVTLAFKVNGVTKCSTTSTYLGAALTQGYPGIFVNPASTTTNVLDTWSTSSLNTTVLTVSVTSHVRAVACGTAYNTSAELDSLYTINLGATPFSPSLPLKGVGSLQQHVTVARIGKH